MDDGLFLVLAILGVAIPMVGMLIGWHREAAWSRRISESADRTCSACGHPEHPMFCMVRGCECDWMTDPEVLADDD
jgi:hypothetical protein